MPMEIKVPEFGESITEVEIGEWLKGEGDHVERDEDLVVIETEKATAEIPAPESGTITKILKKSREKASVGDVIGYIETEPAEDRAETKEPKAPDKTSQRESENRTFKSKAEEQKTEADKSMTKGVTPEERKKDATDAKLEATDEKQKPRRAEAATTQQADTEDTEAEQGDNEPRTAEDEKIEAVENKAPDIRKSLWPRKTISRAPRVPTSATAARERPEQEGNQQEFSRPRAGEGREEKTVPMTPLRRRIAERLVQAQQTAALLTTFNEIDMSAVIALRESYREAFQKKYDIKLGFMSFFVKAAIEALKLIPEVNAEIRGENIVYRNFFDIGVAVGGGKGLVVPVIRNAERLSFAELERAIDDFARRAQENKLKPDELQGGTFTISNGGIYGSLLSTPIINPPQSGILGMHAIQDRPVARDGTVVVRPMMYVALTYDHRIVDGREAVTFLKHIKDLVEDPARILLQL